MISGNSTVVVRRKKLTLIGIIFMSVTVASCTSGLSGEYADPNEKEILDDKWNPTDAKKTVDDMVGACLTSPWLKDFERQHNSRAPIVVINDIENRTDEHIDTNAVYEAIRNKFVNSRKVRHVNKQQRDAILNEISYQNSGAVDKAQAKQLGKQIAANFLLQGNISSIVSSEGKRKNVQYQIELSLTNLETAEVEWTNVVPIKKKFKRSGWGL